MSKLGSIESDEQEALADGAEVEYSDPDPDSPDTDDVVLEGISKWVADAVSRKPAF
jgi:hypothetical protein